VTAGNLQAWRDGACSRLDRKTPEKDPKRDCDSKLLLLLSHLQDI